MMPGHIQELAPVETAREKFERERMTRRAALEKLGVTTTMSLFALFSVDDLARTVGKELERRAAESRVARQVAEELQQSGVTLAGVGGNRPCHACWTRYFCEMSRCGPALPAASPSDLCTDDALYEYERCAHRHCSPSGDGPNTGEAIPNCDPRQGEAAFAPAPHP